MAAPAGLAKPQKLSPELEAVVGPGPLPRTLVTQKLWEYIKANNLQKESDRRIVIADDKLRKLFEGQDEVHMMQMTKLVSAHMTPAAGAAAPVEMPMAA